MSKAIEINGDRVWIKFSEEMPEDGKQILISNGTDMSIEVHDYNANHFVQNYFKLWSKIEQKEESPKEEVIRSAYDLEKIEQTGIHDDGTKFTISIARWRLEELNKSLGINKEQAPCYENWGMLIPQGLNGNIINFKSSNED